MSIDFRLRDFASPYSILKLRRFFEKSQYFSKKEMEQYRERRIRMVLKHAVRNVPYYRTLFNEANKDPDSITGTPDLHAFPRLTKERLRQHFYSLMADTTHRYKPRLEYTSGSTGKPCRFLSDKTSRALEFVFYWRHWSWAGYKLGQRFAELSSHYFGKNHERMKRLTAVDHFTGRILLNSLRISQKTLGPILETIRKYRPKYLKGVASALYSLAFWMQQKNVTDIAFRAVFSTGEMLTPKYRELIERVFNCKALDTYGHMERTVAITECPHGGYHMNSDYGLLEAVDRKAIGEGLGKASILGTSFYNMAMPLIRYEVGDTIELYDDPPECPCGRTLPLVKAINGRHEDVIVTPDENIITSIYITLNSVKGFAFGQFLQEKKNRLEVNLIKNRNFEPSHEDTFLQVLRNFVGNEMEIKLNYIRTDQVIRHSSGKIPIVISKLRPEKGKVE
jgi:phenylacetate-CoA ligase